MCVLNSNGRGQGWKQATVIRAGQVRHGYGAGAERGQGVATF